MVNNFMVLDLELVDFWFMQVLTLNLARLTTLVIFFQYYFEELSIYLCSSKFKVGDT